MVKCEYCGNIYHGNEKVCSSCGATLNQVKEPPKQNTNQNKYQNINVQPNVNRNVVQPTVNRQSTAQKTGNFLGGLAIAFGVVIFLLWFMIGYIEESTYDVDDYISDSGNTVTTVEESFKFTEADYANFTTYSERFAADPADTEAVEYLVWYYLAKKSPTYSFSVLDSFLAQGVSDESEIYIYLAEIFIEFELYGDALMVLDRGYELTKLESIATYNANAKLLSNYKGTQLGDIMVMIFHKDLNLITYDDLSQIKTIKIEDDSRTISYSKIEPEIFEGVILDYDNYSDNMETIVLADDIFVDTDFNVFTGLNAFIDKRYSTEIKPFPYYYDLKFLSLRSSSLSQSAIEQLPTMLKLQGLSIFGSNFKAIGNIESFESLEMIQLSYTEVSNISKLKEVKNLRTFMCNDNEYLVSIEDISEIETLKNLYIEDLETVSIPLNTDKVKLQSLSIIDTAVRNVDFVSKCTDLVSLTINDNGDLPTIPNLSGLTNLQKLSVQTVDDSDGMNSVEFVRNIPNLKTLEIEGGVYNVNPIGTLTTLEELSIDGTYGYMDNNLNPLGALTNLKSFSLNGRSWECYIDVSFLSKTKNVTYLNLSGAENIKGNSIFTLPNLKELYLGSFVGDFSKITQLKNLERLSVYSITIMEDIYVEDSNGFTNVYYIGEGVLSDFTGSLKQLTNLKFLNVGDNELSNIEFARNMTQLENLILDDNYVTDLEPISSISTLNYLAVAENPISNWAGLKEKADLEIIIAYPED